MVFLFSDGHVSYEENEELHAEDIHVILKEVNRGDEVDRVVVSSVHWNDSGQHIYFFHNLDRFLL